MENTFFESINVIEPIADGSCIYLKQGKKITSSLPPAAFIKEGMALFGQDMESVKNFYRKITGFVQKAPILFIGDRPILFFPTHSDTHEKCLFIQYQNINKVIRNKGEILILFNDGTIYKTNLDIRIFKKQMNRCEQFLIQFEQRKRDAAVLLQIKTNE